MHGHGQIWCCLVMAEKQDFQSSQGCATFIPGPGTEVICPCNFSLNSMREGRVKKSEKNGYIIYEQPLMR